MGRRGGEKERRRGGRVGESEEEEQEEENEISVEEEEEEEEEGEGRGGGTYGTINAHVVGDVNLDVGMSAKRLRHSPQADTRARSNVQSPEKSEIDFESRC